MSSVTQRIASIKQPYGGYLPVKCFSKIKFEDDLVLNEAENIHSSLVGLAVDYLTRFMLGNRVDEAFHISQLGASAIGMSHKAHLLLANIIGLDDHSIIAACKLSGFDVCYRSSPTGYRPIENINPDKDTISNIRIMVNRSLSFWDKYGPIICYEPTFEGGYSNIVTAGDGDFLSTDTLWDFKVSKSAPTSKHTLQLLMYYVMGTHSIHDHFKLISNLGIYNPRINIAYICPINSIPKKTITEIENDIICYGMPPKTTNPSSPVPSPKKAPSAELTVSDVCSMTGMKKSAVYADIRAGRLHAHKQGNKYCITQADYLDYLDYIKLQRIILSIFFITVIILSILMLVIL